MARPRKQLPANGLDILREGAAKGLSQPRLARSLGMGVDAFRRILDESPQAREVMEEARAVEHDELHGILMSLARGTPAEYDAAGNVIRAEQPRQLRAAEILWKTRHGYREQGEPPGASATAGVQIIMPAQVSLDQLQSLMPPSLTLPHPSLTHR
ncbi:hypothetical protein FV242_21500 [Methylobacterium sp. WL64]|uniref:hypothetical protein n=1 Tax=Methylobacterium sp. WL64 TaxID=2603894 RepID=UPI0011C79086|nr:hypothetical protein [Methylobacterium sp. WL64]TXN00571.1 hypothetical protein FV242_21500 [Methylobacterium sp. WL64]